MLKILNKIDLNSQNFFLAINLAYALTTRKIDIFNSKIIFYHIHQIDKIKSFKDEFEHFDVISMIREPRNTLVSGLENWKNYNASVMYKSSFYYFTIQRIFNGTEPILNFTKNVSSIKLEDLHLQPKLLMEKFCNMYNLSFNECLLKSSYHEKKWWGDEISGKYLDGFNKNIIQKKWMDKLFFYDNYLIENLLCVRLNHYNYDYKKRFKVTSSIVAFIFTFLPTKYELAILIYNLRNSSNKYITLQAILHSMYYYILRVFLYLRFNFKNLRNDFYLENYLINEKS